jgi:hypothetical protein
VEEAAEVPKILPNSQVTYEPGREPGGPHVHPGTGVPMEGVEHPADGTLSPPVSNDGEGEPGEPAVPEPPAEPEASPEPAVAPPVSRPPRRTPPAAS